MKLSSTEQESIVALLTRIYSDLCVIEEEFQLFVGVDDFRPRIDYFHDAIRAFTSKEPGNRLSVEMLAYDLDCLRYLEAMPLSSFRLGGEMLSAGADLVEMKPGLLAARKRADREVRDRISELYQNYAVLFAALLKPLADNDYRERVDEINQQVVDISMIINHLENMAIGKETVAHLSAAAQHLDEDGIRQMVTAFIQQEKYKKKDNIRKFIEFLKKYSTDKDEKIAAVDQAHLRYVTSQLAIFEESKEMLKKMAAQGMNLVGKFVEASVAQARRDAGIGR